MTTELKEIKDRFSTPRRSKILLNHEDLDDEDLIPKEDLIISFTLRGYIKRNSILSYNAQRRGGKGKIAMKTNEDDCVVDVFPATTHSFILFFTVKGRVYRLKGYKIPIGTSQSKGRAIVNLLNLDQDEKVQNFLVLPENRDEWNNTNLIFVTRKGLVRRSAIREFETIQSNGKLAIDLNEGDELVGVCLAQNEDHILICSAKGQSVRFKVDNLRVIKSRSSTGVIGMDLDRSDYVISVCILGGADKDMIIREEYLRIPVEQRMNIEAMSDEEISALLKSAERPIDLSVVAARKWAHDEQFILTITENGYGKRTSAHEYRIVTRGGKGVKNILTTDRNGDVVASFVASAIDDIILTSSSGKVIRCNARDISIIGRATQGVRIISLDDGEKVVSVAKVATMDEDEIIGEDEVAATVE